MLGTHQNVAFVTVHGVLRIDSEAKPVTAIEMAGWVADRKSGRTEAQSKRIRPCIDTQLSEEELAEMPERFDTANAL